MLGLSDYTDKTVQGNMSEFYNIMYMKVKLR